MAIDEVVDEGAVKEETTQEPAVAHEMAADVAPVEETLPAARTGTYLRAALTAIIVALIVSAIVGVALVVLRPSLLGAKAPAEEPPAKG